MLNTRTLTVDRGAYRSSLQKFDAAVCEAISVSQASASRYVKPHIGYASYVFSRMCSTGIAMIRAAPLSRWARSDFEDWNFSSIAGHARSLLDGCLLFSYLTEPPASEEELSARINIMHLNDCTRRIKAHTNIGNHVEVSHFEKHREELQERLRNNIFFKSLPQSQQNEHLNGKYLMIANRDSMLMKIGFEKAEFDTLHDLWSQYLHVLPMSFYRSEPNGRGSGLENEVDRAYIAQALEICAAILEDSTDGMVEQFPDTVVVRKGTSSTFTPGPASNRPIEKRYNKAHRSSSPSTIKKQKR